MINTITYLKKIFLTVIVFYFLFVVVSATAKPAQANWTGWVRSNGIENYCLLPLGCPNPHNRLHFDVAAYCNGQPPIFWDGSKWITIQDGADYWPTVTIYQLKRGWILNHLAGSNDPSNYLAWCTVRN